MDDNVDVLCVRIIISAHWLDIPRMGFVYNARIIRKRTCCRINRGWDYFCARHGYDVYGCGKSYALIYGYITSEKSGGCFSG